MGLSVKKVSSRRRGPIRDASARKGTKPALSKEYQAVFENTGKAMVIVEEDATISLANVEFEQLSGYTKEEIEGKKSWTEFVARDDRKRVREYHRLRRTDPMLAPRSFEFRLLDRHEKVKNVVLTIGTIPGTSKSMASLLDVTDRRQAEKQVHRDKKALEERVESQTTELIRANKALQAEVANLKRKVKKLEESEELYRNLVEKVDFGINLIDADHNIVMANTEQSKRFNKPVSELIGKKCFREFEKRDAVCPHCPGVQAIATGQPAEVKTKSMRDDQSHSQVRIQTFPIFGQDGTASGFIEVVEDISERKLMEKKLEEERNLLRTMIDNIPDYIYVKDTESRYLLANNAHARFRGATKPEAVVGKTVFELFPQELAAQYYADDQKVIRSGQPMLNREECSVDHEGKSIWNQTSKVPLRDSSGKVVGLIGIARDITERKQMEAELRKSEERYRNLVETMKVGLTSIDEKGLLTYANEQFCRMLGYSMDEVIGRPTVDFYYDEEARKAQEKVFAKRNKGMRDPTPYEVAWRAKDGRKVHTILSPTPHFDADGHYTGSAAIQTDITERKRAEQELRKSQEELQAFMDASPVAVTWSDLQGNIQYINRKHHELFGYTLEDIPTVDAWRRQADQDPAQRERFARWGEELIEAHKQGRSLPPQERTVTCKDGSIRYVMVGGALVSNHNLRIYNDITERKLMEEQLQRYAAELERSNEEVKNFAYIVSHDLRVPLVNLKGYTSELRSALEVIVPNMDTVLPHLTEEKRSAVAMALHEDVPEALEFITTSVSRMDSFINAVLQLSRLGRRELKSESIDMKALVQGVLETLAHHIQERDIQVTVGSLPEVVADRTSMEQIMGNVLGNAVKYLDPERPGQIEVTAETNNGEQLFLIHDNGRGIAEEDMHKVFAPFRRAGKQDTPGEGMGLAYVQTLVRRHGGRIWCESELEKGTTMTFTISQHRAEGGDYVKDR
jgi:PAS domain S-box-containing protein